jgi:hypothetical protein
MKLWSSEADGRTAMNVARYGKRTRSSENCELDLGGSRYRCRLDNISPSGARVNCIGFLQEIWPGDAGVLHLHDHAEELPCRITRIASSTIGLRFEK